MPNDYQSFINDQHSVTNAVARKLAVPPERVVDWRWQMRNQTTNAETAQKFVSLDPAELYAFKSPDLPRLFNVGITPYAMGLMRETHSSNQPCPIRLQLLPRVEELSDKHGIPDPLNEKPNSPVPEVVQVYPDRVAFCVAQLCPIYCRFCFRKRRDNEQGLHFNRTIVERGLAYIRSDPRIRDVLVTGGDPLIASDRALDDLLGRLRKIPHVEIIRVATRTPVTLPYRITTALAQILAKHHPVWISTHFNCAEELTPEARHAVDILLRQGLVINNQTVLLKNVNDSTPKMLDLLRKLIVARVRPYYLFHPHRVTGTTHLRVSLAHGLRLMRELQGKISGFAIPRYMLDTPSGKIPLQHPYLLKFNADDAILENIHGEIWREPLHDHRNRT